MSQQKTIILPDITSEERCREWFEKTAALEGLEVIGPITETELDIEMPTDWTAWTAECRDRED